MIHKNDALAALDESLRTAERTEIYLAYDRAARGVIESIFDGRDHMSRLEALGANTILTLASCGMLGALSVEDGDEPDEASEPR